MLKYTGDWQDGRGEDGVLGKLSEVVTPDNKPVIAISDPTSVCVCCSKVNTVVAVVVCLCDWLVAMHD